MLNDNYYEQAIQAKPNATHYLKLFLSVFVMAGGLALFLFAGPIGFVILVFGAWLFYYFQSNRKLEYEYTFTNGSVDIAAIFNGTRRKELVAFELEQVTMIVPKDSPRIENEHFVKQRDYSSRTEKEKVISMVVEREGKRELITIEPDEQSLAHIRMYARNKIYTD